VPFLTIWNVALKRAAHRPSRKQAVVKAAMNLHATGLGESVTVADIAAEAGMTPAAVYYHYASKEDVLLDGLTAFGDAIRDQVARFLRRSDGRSPADLPVHLLDWLDNDRASAAVWFAYSCGLSMAVEARRRETNELILTEIVKSVKAHNPECSLPHASVIAAALISTIEISARAWLIREDQLVDGQEDEFRFAVTNLGARILATPTPAR
jgi:AcrR family transcriptional regulator